MKEIRVLNVRGVTPVVKNVSFHGVETIRGFELRVGLRLERKTQFQGMKLFVLLEHARGVVERSIELDTCVNREDLPDGYAVMLENFFGDDPELALMRAVAVVLCEMGKVNFFLSATGNMLSVRFSMGAFVAKASVPLATVGQYLRAL